MPDQALADGIQCIKLKPDYYKGYSRKGAALNSMRKFDEAIATYQAGLKACSGSGTEALEKGLASSKKLKGSATKQQSQPSPQGFSNNMEKSRAAQRASKNQRNKADNANTMSSYVQQKRKELQLQKAALEAQLDFIDSLERMSDQEKLQQLFDVIDDDGNGHIDAKELAAAMRRRNANMTFQGSLDKAIDMVAIFDTDGDARLDIDEFQSFLKVMLQELNVSFQEFAEYMVFQTTFYADEESDAGTGGNGSSADVDAATLAQQVKERGTLLEMLADPRLGEIFDLFDKQGTRLLTFKEVAIGLFQLTSNMEQSAKTSMELLLMMDKEDKRTVNYEQFGRLMMGIVATYGPDKTFDEVADELVLALTTNTQITEEDMASLIVADAVYADFQTQMAAQQQMQQQPQQNDNAISFGRLIKLFEVFDANGDGGIDYEEMKTGLTTYETSCGLNNDIRSLLDAQFSSKGFDGSLDKQEFAATMNMYSNQFNVDLHQLIDFMALQAVLPKDRAEQYAQAYTQTFTVKDKKAGRKKKKQAPTQVTTFPDDDPFFVDFD